MQRFKIILSPSAKQYSEVLAWKEIVVRLPFISSDIVVGLVIGIGGCDSVVHGVSALVINSGLMDSIKKLLFSRMLVSLRIKVTRTEALEIPVYSSNSKPPFVILLARLTFSTRSPFSTSIRGLLLKSMRFLGNPSPALK